MNRESNTQETGNSMWDRIKLFVNPFDVRYEDLKRGNIPLNVMRDFTAGLIVAMVAIPLAMGFAMASGLRPEQGIVGGAIAGLIGALFGGSKYQVYGPTAAYIPIIAAMMALYPDNPAQGHAFLVLASLLSAVVLAGMGLAALGRFVALVPHSIVVGFTIGIAVVIAAAIGLKAHIGYSFTDKVTGIWEHIGEFSWYAVTLTLMTFLVTKYLLKISIFIPAPLIALGIGFGLASTVWSNAGITLLKDKYGSIPTDFWVFTPPMEIQWDAAFLGNLLYFVAAIVFVAAVESLLCSRMADRLADNKGTPYNPNKELWGQGLVNLIAPLLNGFPHTGALARTATNIKVGGISPLAGIFKCFTKLAMAAYLATYLERVPMACIAGILLFVATAMVKPAEVKNAWRQGKFHASLMVYTAVMVVVTDFLIGVLSALLIYALFKFFDKGGEASASQAGEMLDRKQTDDSLTPKDVA
jgi:MFS superfamily sulfate permease-like transporter